MEVRRYTGCQVHGGAGYTEVRRCGGTRWGGHGGAVCTEVQDAPAHVGAFLMILLHLFREVLGLRGLVICFLIKIAEVKGTPLLLS